MSETILHDTQAFLVAAIQADGYFADVTVLDERKADLYSDVEKALGCMGEDGKKGGACAVVLSPTGDDTLPNSSTVVLELKWVIRILEVPALNDSGDGTKKPALALVRRVMRILKGFQATGLTKILRPAKPFFVPVTDQIAPVAYEVNLLGTEDDPTRDVKVAVPVIAVIDNIATISCATSGAAIYTTTDGIYPSASNGSLYSGPVTILSACTLRACAFKTGCIASDVSRAVIS